MGIGSNVTRWPMRGGVSRTDPLMARMTIMRFTEIGQQLRAYRLESGMRAEEIAARLGVSRAALYRYEKGEVIKLDTIQRLAELLKISPMLLLGIGVEYYNRPVGFLERIRQLEETADQILLVDGPVCYPTTSDGFDLTLGEAFAEVTENAGGERIAQRAAVEQIMGIQAARKRMYGIRRPAIICIIPTGRIAGFLKHGLAPGLALSEQARQTCRRAAAAEVERIADLLESEPMGLQFGLLGGNEPSGVFALLRSRDRASVAINPFRPDTPPGAPAGVTMITSADEAVSAHQRVAEALWREAVKGAAAAAKLRQMLAEQPA
jgi:transcriptional regulator with XRE-family HTH domain